MFNYYNKVKEKTSVWGSVGIKHVTFMPEELRKALPDIVFQEDNLAYMFQTDITNIDNHIYTCDRFIPPLKKGQSVLGYIKIHGWSNRNFYSFLAEGLLSLVYRDLTGYELAKAVVDIDGTLNDSHTGADACMYDEKNNVIVLGEAKFYKNSRNGIKAIIKDFTQNNIVNKLESLYRISCTHGKTKTILRHNLETGKHEQIPIDMFLSQKIVFAGFVLHDEDEINIKKYTDSSFYDNYKIDVVNIKRNIRRCFKRIKMTNGDYEIIIVHLPIDSKYQLIQDVIEKAETERGRLTKCQIH